MSTNSSSISDKISNFGLRAWSVILAISLIVFAVNFAYSTYLSRQENNARGVTAELQVLSQQLAKYSKEAIEGNAESFGEFTATKARIDAIVTALRKGGAEGVPGYEGSVREPGVSSALKKVTGIWTKMSLDADRIGKSQQQILNLTDTANSFNTRIPLLSARLNEVVTSMSDSGASSTQINLANRQLV